jgi:hypothetical protein
MAPPHIRRLKLIGLTAALLCLYLAPWPGPWWVEPLKPTLTSLAFAILSWSLGVGSWPLTIAFSLSFFFIDVVSGTVKSLGPGGELSQEPRTTQGMLLYFNALIFSPITLWGPIIAGTSAYAVLRAFRPSKAIAAISGSRLR